AFGLVGWQRFGPASAMAQVQAADGGLYRIEATGAVALAPGDRVAEGEVIRTGRAAGSVLELADGSRLEIAPRSELTLVERGRDANIQVARGDIIVEASDQGSGHLFVSTDDCLVSVTGTVFSVKHGARGSRVSVIEGEVHVKQGTQAEQVLLPGDQVSTDPSLEPVPVADDVAWSRFSEAHLALLKTELASLSRDIDALPRPPARFGSTLAGELPADSAVVIALPNLAGTLAEASALIEARVAESEVLRAWWTRNMSDSEGEADLRSMIDHLAAVGGVVGDEILVSLGVDASGSPSAPLVMGAIEDPAAFRKALTGEVSDLSRELGQDLPLRFVDDPAQAEGGSPTAADGAENGDGDAEAGVEAQSGDPSVTTEPDALWVWVGADRFAMTPDPVAMRRLTGAGTLAGSAFHGAIAAAYAEGVDWLFAADLPRLTQAGLAQAEPDQGTAFEGMGLSSARYLVVRQAEREGFTDTRAELSFEGPRQGVASWLAEPAAMGALDFIAPEAHVAAAFVTRAPAELFDEMMGFMDAAEPGLRNELEAAQAEADLDLRSALAAPLGGEFAFALDGPLLPEPAWKLVLEVYDPAALQAAIEQLVGRSGQALVDLVAEAKSAAETDGDLAAAQPIEGAALTDLPRLELSQERVRGRDWFHLSEVSSGLSMDYTYAEGYLVAGASRAVVERALQYRSSGVNLRTAPAFDQLLRSGEDLNVSALMYQNLAPVAAPVGDFLADQAGAMQDLPADQAAILGSAAAGAEIPATLAWVSALPDKLVMSGRSDGGPLGMGLGALLGIDRLMGGPASGGE
ncbi:MAG: FecR domain-containing protein, partial [Chloroflexi bacterium]|nr:FecR domain-containing protein [Chloroflexota bacterium]